MADYISIHTGATIDAAISAVPNKVDAEVGKGLSEANFTNAEKVQLAATIPATTEQVNTGTNNIVFVTPLRLQERLSTGFGTAAQFDVGTGVNDIPQNSDLGTAAYEDITTSPTDTTAGRLLKVGAQGAQLGVDVYRRANILGTVSQSGGVPTGAIIQRGSNANGEFVILADGSARAWHRSLSLSSPDIANGSVFISGNNQYSTPISFIGTPIKLQNLIGPRTDAVWLVGSSGSVPATNQWSFRLASANPLSAQQILCDMEASGFIF